MGRHRLQERHDDWRALTSVINGLSDDTRYKDRESRIRHRDDLDETISRWTRQRARSDVQQTLRVAGLPVAQVASPQDRIELDPATARWGLWPWVDDAQIGPVRVEGLPVHMSDSDWVIERGGPTLGEHNHQVFADLLGLSEEEITQLSEDAVI